MSFLKTAGMSTALIAALALAACGGEEKEVELTDRQEKAMSERLQPAGEVSLEGEVASAAPAASDGGEPREPKAIYDKYCFSCHATGAAGAPKLGDAAAWSDRIAKGMDTLYTHSIQGFRGMPPKGLCMDCSEEEIKATVDYMVEQSQ
jgi:cytochrome c5